LIREHRKGAHNTASLSGLPDSEVQSIVPLVLHFLVASKKLYP